MIAQFYEQRESLPIKLYLLTFLLALGVYMPLNAWVNEGVREQNENTMLEELQKTVDQGKDVPIEQFLSLLLHTTYQGKWTSTMKESQLLTQEQGLMEVTTSTADNSEQISSLILKIYDGQYEEDGFYQIVLDAQTLLSEQKHSDGKLIYETVNPIIGVYVHHEIFQSSPETAIFINKLKFRVSLKQQQPNFQILFAGQYDINIITHPLEQKSLVNQAVFFCFLLLLQLGIQMSGLLSLYHHQATNKSAERNLSSLLVLLSMVWDISEVAALTSICFMNQIYFAIFVLPLGLFLIMIFVVQFKLLSALEDDSLQESNSVKSLTMLFGLFLFYVSNLHWWVLLLFTMVSLVPQIILSYKQGQKISYSLQSILLFCSPRYIILFYLRLVDGNIFHLKPDYLLCLGCALLLGAQIALLAIQKQFGARSILPNFLTPDFPDKFTFLAIGEEELEQPCSICLNKLSELPPSHSSTISYNKVVVTRCKHKFHYFCLQESMEMKLQCPLCRSELAPLDQQ